METVEPKQEKKDDLLAADHKPDTPVDNDQPEKDKEKESVNIKSEKEKDQSPRKSRSKSYDRSRWIISSTISAFTR